MSNGVKYDLNVEELLKRQHAGEIASREAVGLIGPVLEQLAQVIDENRGLMASLKGTEEEVKRLKGELHALRTYDNRKSKEQRRKESIRRNGVTLQEELALAMEIEAEEAEAGMAIAVTDVREATAAEMAAQGNIVDAMDATDNLVTRTSPIYVSAVGARA